MHRFARILLLLALAVGVAMVHSDVRAQDGADDAADEAPEVSVPMNKTAQLTPQQMTQKADEIIRDMQAMLTRIVELQQTARAQKDVIKLNCVNDKLLQIKQLLNIAEGARTNLVEAIALRDEAGRYHQFGQVTIASEKAQGLRDETEACIGEELIFLGPTQVDVDAPDVTDDPTLEEPFADFEVEPPGYASPFA